MVIKFINSRVWDAEFSDQVEAYFKEFVELAKPLIVKPEITVRLSTGLSVTAGRARPLKDHIDLNYRLLKLHPDELRNTIGHEFAHLLDYWNYRNVGHRETWKRIMHHIGLPAKRLHSMNTRLIKPVKEYQYTCLCNRDIPISRRLHNQIRKGISYRCSICKTLIYPKLT